MEFRTTQGGESTLVFEPHEEAELKALAGRVSLSVDHIKTQLTRMKQANPLAGFTGLIGLTFGPEHSDSGSLVPAAKKKSARVDPLIQLEEQIRRRLASTTTDLGGTSQSRQVEATLLAALATCLQTQALLRLAEKA